MDIQVLNEIANQVRQASLAQVKSPVSSDAQLRALQGNPVPLPGNPASQKFKKSSDQIQDPVSPNLSSVARAALSYSEAVGEGLTPDELNAIQALAGKVRSAVSRFLGQPGLDSVEHISDVVELNPETVQDMTAGLEEAVSDILILPGMIDNENPLDTDLPEAVPAPEELISLERITRGAVSDDSAVVEDTPESSRGDFRVAAGPALQTVAIDGNVPVETPVDPVVAAPQPVNRSEPIVDDLEAIPVNQAPPVLKSAPVPEVAIAEPSEERPPAVSPQEPVILPKITPPNSQEVSINSEPDLQNASTNTRADTPVIRVETIPSNILEVSANPDPAMQNTSAGASAIAESPQIRVEASPAGTVEVRVPETVPVVDSDPKAETAQLETPVPVAVPKQEVVSRPEPVTARRLDIPATDTESIVKNAQSQTVEIETPVTAPAEPVKPELSLEGRPAPQPETTPVLPEGNVSQTLPGQPGLQQPAPNVNPASPPPNDLFAQEDTAVNPKNIRDVNALLNAVVDAEFTSEAKKIFSEPKVIRTVADLADFILERLQEIIAAKQLQQEVSSGPMNGIL